MPVKDHKTIMEPEDNILSILLLKMFPLGTPAIYLKQSFVYVGG